MPSSVLSAPRLQAEDRFSAVVEQAEVAARNYDTYQEWALKTYGDSAKTKTVTHKKYSRIVKILRGEESSSMENSKFRFWVKAKGFRLELNDGDSSSGILYVPASKSTSASSSNCSSKSVKDLCQYKRVAVVEDFYDIIYNVHVEMDGRSGRHAGQKRTYRAVAEMYAFLPREAVTRFLMSCSDCQKRMHLQYNNGNNNSNNNTACAGVTPFSVLSNGNSKHSSNVSLISPLLTSNVTGGSGGGGGGGGAVSARSSNRAAAAAAAAALVNRLADESAPDEEEEEEDADQDELEDHCHIDINGNANASHDKDATSSRVLVDCRINSVVDMRDDVCSQMKGQTGAVGGGGGGGGGGRARGAGRNSQERRGAAAAAAVSTGSHTRQHPDQAISKRTNGTSNKRKVSTKSTSASACAAESSSIPKRIRTSQDHCQTAAGHSIEDEEEQEEQEEEEEEEDAEDGSDNLVVVAFDESNGSIDESTSETHLNESGKKSTPSNRNVTKLQGHHNEKLQEEEEEQLDEEDEGEEEEEEEGGGAVAAVVSNSRTVANCMEANKRSFLVSGASSKSENTTTVESVAESKLRTRERLLAALTNLNGVTGVTRSSKQHQQQYQQQQLKGSNNHSNNPVSGGNSCLSPQPLSPSVSDIGMKDEEEDEEDDDEGEGLLAMHTKGDCNGDFDPERLKAFNMFVRLFVDENLDRMVPISRQPKDKIQAIIDSCHRQFPEFTERARKRIRTYLKSCRRTRKHKTAFVTNESTSQAVNRNQSESEMVASSSSSSPSSSTCNVHHSATNGASSTSSHLNSGVSSSSSSSSKSNHNVSSSNSGMVSFTSSGNSYHMTSSLAEQILATACDNEYQNAKRMRLGLKPLAVDYDEVDMSNCFTSATSIGTSVGAVSVLKAKNSAHTSSSLLAALCQQQQQQSDHISINSSSDSSKLRSLQCISSSSTNVMNGNGKRSLTCTDLLDSRENNSLVSTSDCKNSHLLANGSNGSVVDASHFNGCDSIRPAAGTSSSSTHQSSSHHSLNPTESAMVKQLISGYRESAAFLLRSADELEQLLLRQG